MILVHFEHPRIGQPQKDKLPSPNVSITLEPPNKGHYGANDIVPCREGVPISRVPYLRFHCILRFTVYGVGSVSTNRQFSRQFSLNLHDLGPQVGTKTHVRNPFLSQHSPTEDKRVYIQPVQTISTRVLPLPLS